jgi:alkylhydroperoxidase family enzyme
VLADFHEHRLQGRIRRHCSMWSRSVFARVVVARLVYRGAAVAPYELGQHTDVARAAGVGSDEIKAITSDSDRQKACLNAVELAVLHLTTELLTTRKVAAPLFDQLHKALGSEATIEILMVINRWAGLALMLNALDVELDQTARISIPTAEGTGS